MIPGTEGLEPGPELELNDLDLENVEIRGYSSEKGVVSLEGSTFENSNLRGAIIWASVDGANFTNTIIRDATLFFGALTRAVNTTNGRFSHLISIPPPTRSRKPCFSGISEDSSLWIEGKGIVPGHARL